MRVGILTFHDALNYGAVLQAYALKAELDKICECDIINYYNAYFHKEPKQSGIKSLVSNLLYGRQWTCRAEKFEQFRKDFLCVGNEKFSDKDLLKLNNKYDAFIVGSDQVWNLSCSGGSHSYFLDFVNENEKKYSYAASFGAEHPILGQTEIDLLKSFNLISVREKSAVEYLENKINKPIKAVLDPTFLLTETQYVQNFALKEKNKRKKYILLYEVLNGYKIEAYARRLAQKCKLNIICISQSNKLRHGMHVVRSSGPIDWLNLFYNAEYVVTNSFHGLAFSLIFHKQFFVELLPPPATTNARMIELLRDLGLSDRIINSDKNCENNVNYEIIDSTFSQKRKESLDYIEQIVKGKDVK